MLSLWRSYAAAADSAGAFRHRYSLTRHSAAPGTSIVIRLQLRTSSRFFASDLPHPRTGRTRRMANRAFVRRICPPFLDV
ncbi:MAG: hypothetical protein DMD36_01510 [Gemmatimonadetes bacterium]|nr:MAG: hypothetical protein DMD36_01510 [Gemmatimonadota bacterium]